MAGWMKPISGLEIQAIQLLCKFKFLILYAAFEYSEPFKSSYKKKRATWKKKNTISAFGNLFLCVF